MKNPQKIPSRKKFKWYFTIAYSADYTLINKNNERWEEQKAKSTVGSFSEKQNEK